MNFAERTNKMKIDKNTLSSELLELANAANECAAKLDLDRNRTFYGRLGAIANALRATDPEHSGIIYIEDMEAYDYHIVQKIRIKGWNCFLLGDEQAGLIIKKINESVAWLCGRDGADNA